MDTFRVYFDPHFLATPSKYLYLLEKELQRHLKQQKLYNKYLTPRLVAGFGDPGIVYSYSGVKVTAHPWTKTLISIKQLVEMITDHQFNFCLVNKYRNEKDSIGKHQDNEQELVADSPIVLVSLGETRTIKFTKRYLPPQKYSLTNGSMLIMYPPTNQFWFHEIPKELTKKNIRISLTFRKISNKNI